MRRQRKVEVVFRKRICEVTFRESSLSSTLSCESGSLVMITPSTQKTFGNSEKSEVQADLQIHHTEFFRKACLGGSLGVADSYAEGNWDSSDLVKFFRFFLQNQKVMDGMEGGWATLLNKFARWAYLLGQKNTIQGSRKNISLHYDLGNDFYELMLDPTMTYSCGIFCSEDCTLEEASLAKYDRIIDQLKIEPHHHVLEIGCGWGGFAERLAQRTRAKLQLPPYPMNNSNMPQTVLNHWEKRQDLNYQHDYRTLAGRFDRVVSIEMIEAAGHEYLPTYFSKISELLCADGVLNPGNHHAGPQIFPISKEVDYIRTRVFPE